MIRLSYKCQSYQTLVTSPHLQYNLSHVINFCRDVMYINYDVIISTSKYFCFKKTYSFFADIIKIVTMFINTIFKDPQKIKRIRNYVSKCNLQDFGSSLGKLAITVPNFIVVGYTPPPLLQSMSSPEKAHPEQFFIKYLQWLLFREEILEQHPRTFIQFLHQWL